jgi:phage baseplate assembly protein W
MAAGFLGVGWKFPVNMDTRGKIQMSEYEEDIREAIWIILATSKGERVMRPDFGSGIHEFVFATVDIATIGFIESSVREALAMYEPRIEVLNVEVSTEEIHQGKLLISIDYRVLDTNSEFNLVYPFYLTEGR